MGVYKRKGVWNVYLRANNFIALATASICVTYNVFLVER